MQEDLNFIIECYEYFINLKRMVYLTYLIKCNATLHHYFVNQFQRCVI